MNTVICNSAQGLYNIENNQESIKNNTLQEKLFNRVSEVLKEKGVDIEGTGALSLDLREDETIEVIGEINNKKEVEAALTGDNALISILKQGMFEKCENSCASNCENKIDKIEISQQASAAYETTIGFNSIKAYDSEETKEIFDKIRLKNTNIIEQKWFTDGGLSQSEQNEFFEQIQSYLDKLGINKKADEVITGVNTALFYDIQFDTKGLNDDEYEALSKMVNNNVIKDSKGNKVENWFYTKLSKALSSGVGHFKNGKTVNTNKDKLNTYSDPLMPEWAKQQINGENTTTVNDINIEEKKKNTLINLLDLGQGLIAGSDESMNNENVIIDRLNSRIEKQNTELTNRIKEVLLINGFDKDYAKDMTFSVDKEGEIVVTSADNSLESKNKQNEIAKALNSDKDIQAELAKGFKNLDLNQKALVQLIELKSNESDGIDIDSKKPLSDIDNQLLIDLAELKYNKSATEIVEDEEFQDTNLQSVFSQLTKELENDDLESSGTETSEFTIKSVGLDSKNFQESLKKNVKYYDKQLIAAMQSELNKTNMNPLLSFEAKIGNDGGVEITNGEDIAGNKCDKFMKDKAENLMEKIDPDGLRIKTIVDQKLQDHNFDSGDVNEYEHIIYMNVDAYNGCSFEIKSPEADKAAADELENNLVTINKEISENLKEEGVVTPIKVDVNENGKLSADIAALPLKEKEIVNKLITNINTELDKNNLINEQKKSPQNSQKLKQEEVEDEKQERSEELSEFRNNIKNNHIYDLGRKVAKYDNVDYEKESGKSTNTIDNLERKVIEMNEPDVKSNDKLSFDEMKKKNSEISEVAENKTLSPVFHELGKVVELARGLKSILAKFHDRNNLLTAIA